jgi:hypothetical protein
MMVRSRAGPSAVTIVHQPVITAKNPGRRDVH